MFKAKGVQQEHLSDLAVMTLQTGMTLIAFSLLLDCQMLTDLLRGEYLKASRLLGA